MKDRIVITILGACIALMGFVAFAQEKPQGTLVPSGPNGPQPGPAFQVDKTTGKVSESEPGFTKEQSLQLENYDLRDQTLQTQMALLEQAAQKTAEASQKNKADREAYIQALERAHSGWLVNRKTSKWERAPVPAPAQKK